MASFSISRKLCLETINFPPSFLAEKGIRENHLSEFQPVMIYMGKLLDKYEREKFTELVRNGTDSDSAAKTLLRIKSYFVTVDLDVDNQTPLERLLDVYKLVLSPIDINLKGIKYMAVMEHLKIILKYAFEQHLENPEHFNSHGVDHTLNVMSLARSLMKENSEIGEKLTDYYQINQNESQFVVQMAALFHDFGYPFLGNKSKSAHMFASGEIFAQTQNLEILKKLISSPKILRLLTDMTEAIASHGADKKEVMFDAKVQLNCGTILTTRENLMRLFECLYLREGLISDNTMIESLSISMPNDPNLEEKNQQLAKIIPLITDFSLRATNVLAEGRTMDLREKNDRILGMPYTAVDLLNPAECLLAIIRLADNMDFARGRLNFLQRHHLFKETYERFAYNPELNSELLRLEKLISDMENGEKQGRNRLSDQEILSMRQKGIDNVHQYLVKVMGNLSVIGEIREKVKTYADAIAWWKEKKIYTKTLFPYQDQIDDLLLERMVNVANRSPGNSLHHFSGCEAIRKVELKGRILEITINSQEYERLNAFTVVEEGINILVGEYQIWRAEAAFGSVRVGRGAIRTLVKDENGYIIKPSYHQNIMQ